MVFIYLFILEVDNQHTGHNWTHSECCCGSVGGTGAVWLSKYDGTHKSAQNAVDWESSYTVQQSLEMLYRSVSPPKHDQRMTIQFLGMEGCQTAYIDSQTHGATCVPKMTAVNWLWMFWVDKKWMTDAPRHEQPHTVNNPKNTAPRTNIGLFLPCQ